MEISIVLIIIGLLLGGILIGRDLIHIAQLHKMISQQDQFKVAVMVFKNKYNCMPGDCANADQFLGSACGNNTTDPDTGCNGDGSGYIDISGYALGEHLKFWMHLSQANLVAGNFSGRGTASFYGPAAVINTNVPAAVLAGLGWNGVISGEASYIAGYSDIPVKNWGFSYSGANPVGGEHIFLNGDPPLSRADAYFIDSKIDDGLPDTGSVRGLLTGDCNSLGDVANNSYFSYIPALFTPETTKDCQQSFLY